MDPPSHQQHGNDEILWAPGTVKLEDAHRTGDQLVLFPTPTADPNDPLNWSKSRKILNFILASFFVLWTFVQLDIGFTAWGPMASQLHFTLPILNASQAANFAGLAVGCFFMVPLVHKYGRRPMYIFSTALQLAAAIWMGKTYTAGDLIGSYVVSGLGGAISEIIVQITVADIFFVHQHGTMNGWYVIVQSIGTFLAPVASGYDVVSQGWRWIWWWCVIFLGVTLLCVVFLFEESKYISVLNGQDMSPVSQQSEATDTSSDTKNNTFVEDEGTNKTFAGHTVTKYTPKTYRQRIAFITKTDESIFPHFYQPLVTLFTFPAVAYCAITLGSTLCWFAILTSLQASYMIAPPYNFTAKGIGLMNLAPFVGGLIGFPYGGYLCDKTIMWLSKRNGGIYEPEMRLWLALPIAITTPAAILMFGLGLAYGAHWALLAVGYGFYGFSYTAIGSISLSYLMDCYQDIIGDALVGVIFVRNSLSVIILFFLTPWVSGMGMQNLHVLAAAIAFVIQLIPVPLLIWGKKARIATATQYRKMAENQLNHRAV